MNIIGSLISKTRSDNWSAWGQVHNSMAERHLGDIQQNDLVIILDVPNNQFYYTLSRFGIGYIRQAAFKT
jgi:hypothetical protein